METVDRSFFEVGDSVIYINSKRRRLPGLVQSIHGGAGYKHPLINLIVVSPDESRTDQYGRQVEHFGNYILD